ncbi:MAG: hypothetical protein JOZ90_00210 [Alphaproteobacteria bacterium]|nr:hypothetical protein [Alphaproteobacteria bacterium]MBV9370957.1 hypothetical protein [Alphaproteobacteria bacterium]MBV9899500.1 hypothetical protein [Alphaproteobacteria bacterium]
MRAAAALLLLLPLACACSAGHGEERAKRVAAIAFPEPREIDRACEVAGWRAAAGAERNGVVGEPVLDRFVSRNAACRWDGGSRSAAACRFERTWVPMEVEGAARRRLLARLGPADWHRMEARFVHVRTGGGSPGAEWVAASPCATAGEEGR